MERQAETMERLRLISTKVVIMAGLLAGCASNEPRPPVAGIQPHTMEIHGHTRVDDYYWLNQRENPEVISYLEQENEYLRARMAHTEKLQSALFEEMKGRIQQDDSSVPYEKSGYWYYTRFVPGGEYALHCRRAGSLEGPEEILIDGNALGRDEGYFSLRAVRVSPDTKRLVYAVDTQGRRWYTLSFRDIATGDASPEVIENTNGNVVWANDNRTVFYGRRDPETLRSFQIWRHVVGTSPASDVLVYQEDDETFSCYVSRTRSDRFLMITSDQTLSTETRILEADDPRGEFQVFHPRQRDHEYHVDHQGDRFLVRTNLDAPNFRLMECGLGSTGSYHWKELVPHRAEVLLEDAEAFDDWTVLTERRGGLAHLRILPVDGSADHDLEFPDPTWSVWTSTNPSLGTDVLRFTYQSLTTPNTTFAYDMRTRERTVLKQQVVLGGFDRDDYVAEYLRVPAHDGVLVPVSIVRRKDTPVDGTAPLLLYAYGSYGSSSDAGFRSNLLSLLDRGFIYAIAHIRGGQEMGRHWYEDGKLLRKRNTFTDFIDCGRHLVAEKYARPDALFANGGSAGGLLMGAVMNMEPELWSGVVAAVPFVDVVTTMLDESIPLTTFEFDEWGNPKEKVYYDYMLSYSPYDQVESKDYPPLLVTTGLHDSQVQYFEPAKWVAKLRARKTDDNPLLFRTNMEAGHGGKSGRFRRLEETALMYAFLLDLAGD